MASLYEITGQMAALRDMFEVGDIDEQTLHDTMESLDADMEAKVEGYGKIIAEFNGDVKAVDSEIERLRDKKDHYKAASQRMKDNLYQAMCARGVKKIKGGLFTASIQKNPASVAVLDMSAVPDEYLTQKDPEPNKTAIKDALKDGKEVPGCELRQSEGVRIR